MDIRAIIKQKGLTNEQVAERMGISRVTLQKTLANSLPRLSTLYKLADAIGCKVGDFFKDDVSAPTYTESVTIGLIHSNGKPYVINSLSDLERTYHSLCGDRLLNSLSLLYRAAMINDDIDVPVQLASMLRDSVNNEKWEEINEGIDEEREKLRMELDAARHHSLK